MTSEHPATTITTQPTLKEHRWSTVAAVMAASYFGVLIRIGLQYLAALVSPIEVFPSFYAEFVGCIFMGFAVILEDKVKNLFFPLFPFLTTGLAGSITTFSSWNQEASLDLTGLGPYPTQRGTGVRISPPPFPPISSCHCLSFPPPGSCLLDHHCPWLWDVLDWLFTGDPHWHPHFSLEAEGDSSRRLFFSADLADHIGSLIFFQKKTRKEIVKDIREPSWSLKDLSVGEWLLVLLAILPLFALVPLAILVENLRWITLSVLFAPFGTVIRWVLCSKNLVWFPRFPLGTFGVNVFGTVLLACLNAVSLRGHPSGLTCDFLLALQTGFCGCLTTVSSFQHELYTLDLEDAYIYSATSVMVSQVLLLVVNGITSWTTSDIIVAACQS